MIAGGEVTTNKERNKMANTKNVEVIELKKAGDNVDQSKVGKLETGKESEAGGRSLEVRYAQCSNCGFVGRIVYDTVNYHYYRCSSCGAVLVI